MKPIAVVLVGYIPESVAMLSSMTLMIFGLYVPFLKIYNEMIKLKEIGKLTLLFN